MVLLLFQGLIDFFTAVKEAAFGFEAFSEFAVTLYYSITENPDMQSVWSALMGILNPIIAVVPYILIVLMALVSFFGKKIIGIIKFIAFFIVGFALGLYYVTPLISSVISFSGVICGLIIGILAAVLYRFLYIVLYTVSITYSVYILCYKSFVPDALETYALDKSLVALLIAVLVLVLAFIFKKYVEMLGTSLLGGYMIAIIVKNLIFDYTALGFLGALAWIAPIVIMLVVAIPGFIVQVKTRRRY